MLFYAPPVARETTAEIPTVLGAEPVRQGSNDALEDQRLKQFVEAIANWREQSETRFVPFIDTLISTPVRNVHQIVRPRAVKMSSTLLETIEAFHGSRNVIVKKVEHTGTESPVEVILDRLTFIEQALQQPSLELPLSSVVEKVPILAWVNGDDTLDIVMQRMISSGFEEVGVMNGGIAAGILHLDDIITYILHEMTVSDNAQTTESKGTEFHGQKYFGQSIQELRTGQKLYDGKLRRDNERGERDISPLRLSALDWCKNGFTEVLIMSCLLLDLMCSVVEWNMPSDDISVAKMIVATGIILFVYLFERTVRNYAYGSLLRLRPMEVFDNGIIGVSVIVYILVLISDLQHTSKSIMTVMRVVRLLRLIKVFRMFARLFKNRKMRYNQDGFGLDMAYITNSCIAMSMPVLLRDSTFRNQIKEVLRFFTAKYPGRYLIFNLCAESSYSEDYFAGRVKKIEVENNQPPRMQQMVSFVEHAGRFLDEHQDACFAVHCSSGEGRTGVMVAAWLLYSTFSQSADDAMRWYATRWTGRKSSTVRHGIPMPSQRRYVGYMQDALAHGGFHTHRMLLSRVVLRKSPSMDGQGGCNLWLAVAEDGTDVYCTAGEGMHTFQRMARGQEEATFHLDILIAGDIRISCYHRSSTGNKDILCCFFCFHTGFVRSERLTLHKSEIDMAADDSKCRFFDKGFAIQLEFDQCLSGPPGQPVSPKNGAAIGPFQKIIRPSDLIVESASKMRYRDRKVQNKFARRLEKVVGLHKFRQSADRKLSVGEPPAEESETIVIEGENLCCAVGPVVAHNKVHLFKARNGVTNPSHMMDSGGSSIVPRPMQDFARNLVSGNKRRFSEEGFDLDLTYITPRVIAMGFPSRGLESHYRNSEGDVYRFFQERHAAHYLIVNLCSERGYELDTFHGNCVRYPFPDHNPPALELLLPCCARVHAFLQADDDNVAAIHCKAGKGRTGTVVVAYLMYCGFKTTAADARAFYDEQRTKDSKGLTIISQIRYVHYFEQVLRTLKCGDPPLELAQDRAPAMQLLQIRFHTVPRLAGRGCIDLTLAVSVKSEQDHEEHVLLRSGPGPNGEGQVNHARADCRVSQEPGTGRCDVDFGPVGMRVAGDFHVDFFDRDLFGNAGRALHFWLHTALLVRPPPEMCGKALTPATDNAEGCRLPSGARSLLLRKHELDVAAKDKRCSRFDADFAVEIFYLPLAGEAGTGPSLEAARFARLQAAEESLSGGAVAGSPLLFERDGYRRAVALLERDGKPAPHFDEWIVRGGANTDADEKPAGRVASGSLAGNSGSGSHGGPQGSQKGIMRVVMPSAVEEPNPVIAAGQRPPAATIGLSFLAPPRFARDSRRPPPIITGMDSIV